MSACVHGATVLSAQPVSGNGWLNRALGCPALMVLVGVMLVEMMMTIPCPVSAEVSKGDGAPRHA